MWPIRPQIWQVGRSPWVLGVVWCWVKPLPRVVYHPLTLEKPDLPRWWGIVWQCVGLVLLVVTFLLNIKRKMRCSFSYIFIWPQFCIKALNLWDNIVKFWIWKLRQGALNHCCNRIVFSAEAIKRAKKIIDSSTGFLIALNDSHTVLNSRQYTAKFLSFSVRSFKLYLERGILLKFSARHNHTSREVSKVWRTSSDRVPKIYEQTSWSVQDQCSYSGFFFTSIWSLPRAMMRVGAGDGAAPFTKPRSF